MKRFIILLLSFLVVAFIMPKPADTMTGIYAGYCFLAAVALAAIGCLLPQKANTYTYHTNGVNVEIWVRYIIEKFWKQNKFLQYAFNDDQYVIGGSIIHIPQPGSSPTVVKNRSSYPATAVQRTDTDITFALDVFTTDPTHITDAEKVELSYDKMNSVLGDHTNSLNQTVANDILIKWLTGYANTVLTSGGATAGLITGQTGTRNVLVHGDLRKAQLKMNLDDVPEEDRCSLLEANMADQLFESLSNTQYRDFSQYADAEKGVIGKLYGFNIMTRSSVAAATSANSVLPLGTAVGATDNVVSVCWQKDAVTRALGEVKVFSNPDRAEYYGDILSGLLRAGARRRRSDNKGLVAIVQSA